MTAMNEILMTVMMIVVEMLMMKMMMVMAMVMMMVMAMVMMKGGLVVGTEGAPHLALIWSLMIFPTNHDDDQGDDQGYHDDVYVDVDDDDEF